MIRVHKINNQEFTLNASMIEQVEATPDTVVLLTNGKRMMVRETPDDVVNLVIAYKRLCNQGVQIEKTELNNG